MKVVDLDIPMQLKELILQGGIVELFPPQQETVEAGALKGRNLVLASPTASGKTLVAELCCLKHVLERGGKAVYLAPLRALASEKYDDFQRYTKLKKTNGQPVNVGISTGDFDSGDPWLGRYDIIITTNEKADSLLRHRAKWMDEISLVVADEVHLLNEAERGPTLEVVLARLMEVNPDIQVLALSATMGNVDEIAGWLKAEYVITEWRPVNLKEGVLLHDEIQFKDGDARKIERKTSNDAVNLALNTVKTRGQALVFASTRRNAASLTKKIADQTGKELSKLAKKTLEHEAERIRTADEKTRLSESLADLVACGAAFHHAGLAGAHRKIIEDLFRQGRIKVLTATPTLAFGMNLPARIVVVQDYRRYAAGYGYYPISVLEYKQMAGRAGRPKYDKNGEAILIAKNADEADYLMENFILARPERIWSRLAVEKILRGHVLATVASDFAHTENGVYEFFGRTFYAYQYDVKAIKVVIANILKYLFDEQLLYLDKRNLYATPLGKRASELYIDPVSAVTIREALKNKPPQITELSLLHLITHTPDMGPVMRPYGEEIEIIAVQAEQHREELFIPPPNEWDDQFAFQEYLGELKTAMILKAWIEETSEEKLMDKYRVQPGDLYRIIENGKWLLHAVQELAGLLKEKELSPLISELNERVSKGIKKELLPIVKLDGVGRTRGRVLFDAGYRTVEDVRRATLDDLTYLPTIGPRLAKKIKEQVGGFVKKNKWEQLDKVEEWKQKALSDF
ncbi:MAG: DEAD/DEAH box helicase [Candidatus Bathyarchaeota archaeon]|nr:DEAD/DEAH box helicase [Candidatus Bathyarchaeota archaeon]